MKPSHDRLVKRARTDAECDAAELLLASLRIMSSHASKGTSASPDELETAFEAIDLYEHLQNLSRTDETDN